jgi:hypothetical protein
MLKLGLLLIPSHVRNLNRKYQMVAHRTVSRIKSPFSHLTTFLPWRAHTAARQIEYELRIRAVNWLCANRFLRQRTIASAGDITRNMTFTGNVASLVSSPSILERLLDFVICQSTDRLGRILDEIEN